MKNLVVFFCLSTAALLAGGAKADGLLEIDVEGAPLIGYQAEPMKNPKGGERFRGSNFIHPLKTPSGFMITDLQPGDHLHHFGLWWPWKYVSKEGRKVLFWELQRGDGIIEARQAQETDEGFTAESIYNVRPAEGEPEEWIRENLTARVSGLVDSPAEGYVLDLEIVQRVLGPQPLEIVKYSYSGFSLRSTAQWNHNNSTMLTSEGKEHPESNLTRARWVLVQGPNGAGGKAGVVLMSHPENHGHPEHLYTWNPRGRSGGVFANFNPVQNQSMTIRTGETHTRRYRLFVFDGEIDADAAERLWKEWAATESFSSPLS